MPAGLTRQQGIPAFATYRRAASAIGIPADRGAMFCAAYSLTKYGTNMSTVPMMANTIVLATKYGKIMSVTPHTSGTTALCFLPYMKYANPKAPNIKPQRSHHSFNSTSRFRAETV